MAKPSKSALSVQAGIEQPVAVNPHFAAAKRREPTIDDYVQGILAHDRVMLSRAITMIESVKPAHAETAQQIIERCLPHSGNALRIGITGVPGVGKSTFIESFGKLLTGLGHKVAVLAIDPSSERSKGSILGDKTRMEELSADPDAYIRPSPSGSTLGGVARKTRETVILCEAAGFDIILVETVGVGQSETVVKSMVDFFLLLMLAGAGDELQGIKRGIMEMADALVITKADGDNRLKAENARTQYKTALHLFPKNENQWTVPVTTCSAIENRDLDNIWKIIGDFVRLTKGNGFFEKHRNEQLLNLFYNWMNFTLQFNFYNSEQVRAKIDELLPEIAAGKISPYKAAAIVMESK